MFEDAFVCPGVCEFVHEDLQEVWGVGTASVAFRVHDDRAWMSMLPKVIQAALPFADDFSWVVRKEFYSDGEAVRFIWVVFAWSKTSEGLGMASRVLRAQMVETARSRTGAQAGEGPRRVAPGAASERKPATQPSPAATTEEDTGVARLRGSARGKTVVHGVDRDGTIRSSTPLRLGRRSGAALYVVDDPAKRTVRATRPSSGDNTSETAASGISGRPRVHVEGLSGFEGGSFAATEL